MADTMAQMEEKVNYAQTIINILQTKLNESVGQNIQLEAKLIRLTEDAKTKVAEPDTGAKGES
ncbi:MAG TPA: hypothetical protein EYQ68_06225 [Cytophagales bacterium]|jgi:regulator of replication initiation timing|nr:hypothetical protein [Cytophagales bacterium]